MSQNSPSYREGLLRLGRLIRKELIEIIRDRRTIVTLVLMPLLLYPLLSIAFQQFFLASSIEPNRSPMYRFGFATKQEFVAFFQFLAFGDALLDNEFKTGEKGAPPPRPERLPRIVPDLDQALRDGEIDLAVRLEGADRFELPLTHDMVLGADIRYLTNNPTALGALGWVERRLGAVQERNLATRLNLPDVEPKVALVHLTRRPLATAGGDSMISLAALVPLILILMTITGAVYPAIDLTAGERERGTLEILVAAPVPRLGLLFAKYVSVFSVAVATAFVNLVTMALTLIFSGLSKVLFAGGLSPLLIVELFGLLLLFAAFFSAVLLTLTSFARSFKEAQAYLIPLMLASLGPGLIGMMPGLELQGPVAVVPLINIVLLARDLVQGGADPAWALVVVLTTLGYAGAAIAVAARVFGAEGVLYNEQSGWADLLRRPVEAQAAAPIGSALWCLVLMIPTHFALQWLVLLPAPWLPRAWPYLAMGVVGVILFGGLPALAAYMSRVRFVSGFGLGRARLAAFFGALLLGASLWPLVIELLFLVLRDRSEELKNLLGAQLEDLQKDRQVLALVLVVQAALEELFFRGYLFGALRQRLSAGLTIGSTALLFALLHVVMGGALGGQRLLPSFLLGLVLGWVRSTSGSVLPGILLHACHNAILSLAPAAAAATSQHVAAAWLAAGAAGSCVGALLVWCGRKKGSRMRDEG